MICDGCGASYDSDFKFCPYCGRARPEPVFINVQIPATGYEEGALKLNILRKKEQVLWMRRPNFIGRLLGESRQFWGYLLVSTFTLISIHPHKGQYIAYTSPEFRHLDKETHNRRQGSVWRGFIETDQGMAEFQTWFVEVERQWSQIWEQFNTFLIQNAWTGVTQIAIERKTPWILHTRDDLDHVTAYTLSLETSDQKYLDAYRYKRQISQG